VTAIIQFTCQHKLDNSTCSVTTLQPWCSTTSCNSYHAGYCRISHRSI